MRPVGRSPTTRFLPGPLKRLRGLLREIQGTSRETRDLAFAVRQESSLQSKRLSQLERRVEDISSEQGSHHEQVVEILRLLHSNGHRRRAQLHQLRAETGYERPFSEPDPLVSVVIATYDNYELLGERSIPSVLAQSYQNFEVIVVGDAAPDRAREVVEGIDDVRISFFNLPYRGPYPADSEAAWLVSGVHAWNEAVRRARGLWIAPLDDDDAFRPQHLERLLEHARVHHVELAYSRLAVHVANAPNLFAIGRFPPELGQIGLQAAIYHAGLKRIFEYELADAAFQLPIDWAMCLRMMEAGVRIGMVEEVSADYYPAKSWRPGREAGRSRPRPEPDGQGEYSQ